MSRPEYGVWDGGRDARWLEQVEAVKDAEEAEVKVNCGVTAAQ